MPLGWHKPELDRLGRNMPQPIRANTYKELVQAVTKFRADNGIPLGDTKAEIDEYICTNYPHMCHKARAHVRIDVEVKARTDARLTLTDDMIQWLESMLVNHSMDQLELKSEAMRRAEICRKCPMNVRWNRGCGSCVEAVNRLSAILRYGKELAHARELRACRILRHENRAAVWLRKSRLGMSDALPSNCWLKE